MMIEDEETVRKVYIKAMDIWKQFDGMQNYEVGGVVIFLVAMFVASYAEKYRGGVFNMVGRHTQDMIDEIDDELVRKNPERAEQREWKVEFSDQASDAMLKDPELREAVNDMTARIRQKLAGIDMTDREAVAKAMAELGAEHVTPEELQEKIGAQGVTRGKPN